MGTKGDGTRIVVASECWHGATGAGLSHGFRKLGWDVVEIDPRDHFVSGKSLRLRAAGRLLRRQCRASYNRAVREAVALLSPRWFVTVKGSDLERATLVELKRRGVVTANYYPDVHFDHPGVDPSTFSFYSHFFTTKSFQVDHLRRTLGQDRVRFLHHGYSSLVHRPRMANVREADYVADVLYVGNHSPYKERWLVEVARSLPDVRFMIVGSRWQEAGARMGPQAIVVGHHILGDGYARLLQQARINIALHSGPDPATGWQDLVSTRTFEIPACKGFMLHIDNPEVRTLYEPGTEIDVFRSPEELCEKIRYYLPQPELRREMIERAYVRCVPAYSYDARAEVIASAMSLAAPERSAA